MSGASEPRARPEPLSAAKRALLEQRLRGGPVGTPVAAPVIVPRPPSEPPALSPGQQRLWFLHQLAPDSAAYTMAQAFRFEGALDVDALERSLNQVIARHESLRTTFEERGGRPVAVVSVAAAVAVARVDTGGAGPAEREEHLRAQVNAEARRPFDLRAGPLIRAAVFRQSATDHVLLLVLHHIVCDEWSLDVLWQELAACYQAFRAGERAQLPALPLQYADYAAWQRTQLGTPGQQAGLAWWRDRLRAAPAALDLPLDHARPPRQSFRGGLESMTLSPELTEALRVLARREEVTSFVLLLAAFATLLHRYTGETDIVVGAPFTGRTRPELEPLIGFFINSLVLRLDLSDDPTFGEVVRRARGSVLDVLAHQDVPFELLVDALQPERVPGHNPLFQVMFVLQREAAVPRLGPGLHAEPFAVDTGAAKLDLTLFVTEAAARPLEAMIEYAADLFDRETIRRMLEHLSVLLRAVTEQPDRPVSALPLLSDAERRRMLLEWNDTASGRRAEQCIHHLFHAHAARAPDATAIVTDDEQLTYGELAARADRIAHRLRALGVGPNVCVGLCAERSPDLLAGMLGILTAGGAYVPLDPEYPEARLRFALEQTRAPVVLARRSLADRIPATAARVVCIDAAEEHGGTGDAGGRAAGPDDLAYVIFTSGSTGQPKGVPITHRNLVHSTLARTDHYGEGPRRFLLLPSFAFDSSVAGIFWTLCTGGTLVLPPHRIEQDAHALAERIGRHRVTHLLCLPSVYAALLQHAPRRLLEPLTTVIVAGEACQPAVAARHWATVPDVTLHNEYGPTEATVWSTAYRVPRAVEGPRVPIGRPIADTRVYVLDAAGAPAPIGVAGELYIGGSGVARGYLDRPEETAARFVVNPFATGAEERLYRTGDRVRWRADGQLEFLGRVDQQLKVRGHRIEPAEIEAALAEYPGIRESLVTGWHPADAGAAAVPVDAGETEAILAALRTLEVGEADRMLREIEAAAGEREAGP